MRRQAAGFSLLELLVVLFVVVLITSTVNLNVGSGGQDIELEGSLRNLADVTAYALDEAQMLGLDYGLVLSRGFDDGIAVYGYRWLERRPEGWREPRAGGDIFEPVQLPPGIDLYLELENVPVDQLSLAEAEAAGSTPQVVLYSSGETTPGAIEVRREASQELLWRLEWDLLGRVEMLYRGLPEEEE